MNTVYLLFCLLLVMVVPRPLAAQYNTKECIRLLQNDGATQALSAQEAYQLLDTLHAQESVTALEQAAKGMSEKVQLRVQALGARF
ncbi:MAG: hypothetical protein JNM68_09225, partial [Dinghuibacter sp.]|nr:hypothetical protein [Dinghuibacter sp.]